MDNADPVNGVEHYENFPVASVLCPPALRPPIVAIYHFARTADDIADEGDAAADDRLLALSDYRSALQRLYDDDAVSARWPDVFGPLRHAVHRHALPQALLADLLDAFAQDVRNPPYPDRDALLDYCRRSANPVGRLLLHLYGVQETAALRQSDAICSALQLINFWQDLSVDLPRGRCYVPESDRVAHGIARLEPGRDTAQTRALVRDLCSWAEGLMREGAPLVHRLPGRAGWELRLVVQGGLRILETIAAMDHATLSRRPALGKRDVPRLLWRALWMRA
ncbi:squalene synthase HpnC [Rubrivivax albus]|uniref:Squalene synthase HpnC n=1 Tax=Rubrivivax albus TaxID=2499835 RepID=A0A3S2WXN4_9BURK|nr:squalene synthase HpnC [Rubrivivax albus]RVT54142.1 squalene synthase HpnC [Rubrivivax albus]